MTVETLPEIDTTIDLDIIPYEDEDDGNEHLTHIISPPENRHISDDLSLEAKDILFLARMGGLEVVALCGYKFVPKRNPEKYPACQQCMDIAGHIMRSLGE